MDAVYQLKLLQDMEILYIKHYINLGPFFVIGLGNVTLSQIDPKGTGLENKQTHK